MEEHGGIILPVIGFLLVLMISIIGFLLKGWVSNLAEGNKEILKSLDNIKEQISDLKLESAMQRSHIQEMESRIESRLQGVETRVDRNMHLIGEQEGRLNATVRDFDKVKTCHNLIHPEKTI